MKPVKCTLDNLPEPSSRCLSELTRLEATSDKQIDASDAPELSTDRCAGAVRSCFYSPVKQQVTARFDANVLALSKTGGEIIKRG